MKCASSLIASAVVRKWRSNWFLDLVAFASVNSSICLSLCLAFSSLPASLQGCGSSWILSWSGSDLREEKNPDPTFRETTGYGYEIRDKKPNLNPTFEEKNRIRPSKNNPNPDPNLFWPNKVRLYFPFDIKDNICDILILYHNFGQQILQEKFHFGGILNHDVLSGFEKKQVLKNESNLIFWNPDPTKRHRNRIPASLASAA